MNDPRRFRCADTLTNGLAVTIRHLRANDRERIANASRQLDREPIHTRLFSYGTVRVSLSLRGEPG